jgi:hypothetical protein
LPNRSRAGGAGFGGSVTTGSECACFGPLAFSHSTLMSSPGGAHAPFAASWLKRLPSPRVYFSHVMSGGRSAAGVGAGPMRSLRAIALLADALEAPVGGERGLA